MERREVGEKERGRFSPPWLDSVAAKNRSSVRRSWFIAKDRWLARRNKELRAFHDGLLANTMPPVRAEFSQPSHLATRAPDTNRGCARADTGGGGGRGRERGEEAGHVCIHTRASGVQVIRAISSKFRSNEISRVVVPLSPSLPLSLSLSSCPADSTVYTNSVHTRALLDGSSLPASLMVFLTVFIYHGPG